MFFERNGLRHGEFALREVARDAKKALAEKTAIPWGYRVRDLAWSADSNVLAVWIEREGASDVGMHVSVSCTVAWNGIDECLVVQLWATGNYHWYGLSI